MPAITVETEVRCTPEQLFDVITDLRGQDKWLTPSSAYRGTQDISPEPLEVGTTYREPGPAGVRNGTVVELERPTTVAFHQPMTMRFRAGTVDILMRYTLAPAGEATRVRRTVTLGIPWTLKPVQPMLIRAVRHESERTLRVLKAYGDGLG